MNITYIKKLPGVPADRIVIKKIVDEQILSKSYAMRIADYILDFYGRKWWTAQGQMAATEMLYQFDDVEFWADGVRYEGFLPFQPDLSYNITQGKVDLLWSVTVLFLKDEYE